MTNRLSVQEKLMAIIIATAWLLAAINPLDRGDWLLENLLVFATLALLSLTRRRFQFSTRAYWLVTVFTCLHLYGSHYTYAETPLGYWVQQLLQQQRNHYDRFVHFCFGALLCYPFMELIARKTSLQGNWLTLITLAVILALSTCYELAEMLATLIVEPELGTAFLGAQGDEWDAQKDTGLAFLGALLVLGLSGITKCCTDDLKDT